jgi:hypothetical protein
MKMYWKNVKKIGKGVIGVILVFIFMSSCFVKSKFDNPTDGFGGLLLEGASLLFAVSEGNITVSGILKDSNGSIIASGILDIARSGSASIQQRASADSKVYSDANGKFSMNIYQGSFTIQVSRADGTSVGSFSIKVSSATATPEVLSSTGLQVSGISAAPVGGTIVTNTISLGNVPTEINEGASKTITVKLSVKSSATITLQVTSDCGCFDFNGSTTNTLTFSPDNSTIEQNLVITSLIDSNTVSEVGKISFTSSDLETTNISIINKEVIGTWIDIESVSSTISEGGTNTLNVKLNQKPKENIVVSLTSDINTSVTVNPTTLTFTPQNYSLAQVVTLNSLEDLNETSETVTISAIASGIANGTYIVTTIENDTKTVFNGSLVVKEGETSTISITLSGNPGTNRSVSLISSNTTNLSISPVSFNFTSSNWNTPQTITLKGETDNNRTDESGTITASGTGLISTTSSSISITDNSCHSWGCYDDPGNGTILFTGAGVYNGTNLVWSRCSQGQTYNFASKTCIGTVDTFQYCNTNNGNCDNGTTLISGPAFNTCNNLNLNGGFGGMLNWRVPTKSELESIVYCSDGTNTPLPDGEICGDGYKFPTVKSGFFPNNKSSDYWTSSVYSNDEAWGIFFNAGYSDFNSKTFYTYVRCVSGP